SKKDALKLLDDANAAIHYNREILQTALDHVRQGIAVFNKDLQLTCWNRQFGEMLELPPQFTRIGTPLEEILRHNVGHGALDAETTDALVRERIARYVSASEAFLERNAERDLVIEVRANRMPDGGIVTTFTDITPSVKAAEELERANESLERRVQERTEELTRLNTELKRAKAEAEEANISKTRFLAAASHDILQPLNAARLYVTSLVDRRLLRRLLQNLVSNAIKYTPRGRVLVGCRRRRGRLRIEVWDTGLGIPRSKKQAVFKEFHRLDQGAKVARGLGLGLSIVERIARVLDHKVDLASTVGRGSRFSVEVPLSSARPAKEPPRKLIDIDRGQLA